MQVLSSGSGRHSRAFCIRAPTFGRFTKTVVQALAAEHRAAQGNASALDRELAAREGQAAGQAAELTALREAHAKAQAQLNQSALDVQVTAYLVMHSLFASVNACYLSRLLTAEGSKEGSGSH